MIRTVRKLCLLLASGWLVALFPPAFAQAPSPAKTNAAPKPTGAVAVTTTTTPAASTNAPARARFRPLTNPAPKVSLTGGSRGTGDATVTLDVLAPDKVGLTAHDQPSLFWYQSRPSKARFELALLEPNRPQPLHVLRFDAAAKSGIQRFDLSSTDVRLSPGIEYQWVVALVTDPENRSTDLVASGFIQRVAPDAALTSRIEKAAPDALVQTYTDAGLWYDALTVLADRIAANPADTRARQTRATLLQRAGLKAAATFDTAP